VLSLPLCRSSGSDPPSCCRSRIGRPLGSDLITLPVLILHGTHDQAMKPSDAQLFFDTTGSTDKMLKLYEGHFHDLLNDVDKERVMADILEWLEARLSRV
jgi:alpha-beta hydrolase superfamily lysophospholipase